MEGLRGPDVGSGLVLALPCCWGLVFDALLVWIAPHPDQHGCGQSRPHASDPESALPGTRRA